MVQRDQTKENLMSWACGTYGGQEIGIRAFVVKPKHKEPTRKTWEKNNEMHLQPVRALTGLIWLRIWPSAGSVVNMVMKLRVPYNGKIFVHGLQSSSFLRRDLSMELIDSI